MLRTSRSNPSKFAWRDFSSIELAGWQSMNRLRNIGILLARFLAGCWKKLCHWHPAVLATLLALVVWLIEDFDLLFLKRISHLAYQWLYWVAIAIVGAARRSNRREIAIMAAIALVTYFVLALPDRMLDRPLGMAFPILYCGSFIFLLAAADSYFTSSLSSRKAIWILGLSVGAASVHALIANFLRFCGWRIQIPTGYSTVTNYSPPWVIHVSYLVYWPLLSAITWIVIPMAEHYGAQVSARRRAVTISATICLLCGYFAFVNYARFEIAAWSLPWKFPFRRDIAVQLLTERGRPSDHDLFWQQLERDDWEPLYPEYPEWDWRVLALDALAQRDSKDTARRLSELLQAKPRHELAKASAKLLVVHQHFECVPILMRYALVDKFFQRGSWAEPLETLGIPQAAQFVFIEAVQEKRWKEMTENTSATFNVTGQAENSKPWSDVRISQAHRDRLKKLLVDDVGDHLTDWLEFYELVIDDGKTPMSAEQHRETQRVVKCVNSFMTGFRYWAVVRNVRERRYALERLRDAGFREESEKIQRLADVAPMSLLAALSEENSEMYRAILKLDEYFREARWKVWIQEPNWDAENTRALQQEVLDYLERVRVAVVEEFGKAPSDIGDELKD